MGKVKAVTLRFMISMLIPLVFKRDESKSYFRVL